MQYFTFYELEYSDTARRNGIKNTPSAQQEENLRKLTENLLDPIRRRYGRPILVGSGFRNPQVNRLAGGASNSQHLTGCAADLQTCVQGDAARRAENKRLFDLIREMGGFDQLINEHNFSWVHVSYNPNGPQRGEVLTIK